MNRLILAATVVTAVSLAPPCFAQSATPEGVADQFAKAWSNHDKAAFARLFTEDARFMPTYDVVFEGHANVVAGIYEAHEGWARETTLTTSKVGVQQLRPDTAVVHFNVAVNGPAGIDRPPLGRSLLLVAVKQQDGWKVATGQLTKPNCPPQ